ncbi:MAG TPA: cation diffusion facilitator family transporter [Gaiellaceae bacterium]|jgi:cation diffusion facilitator family transporter|nr:cation diffusion facilitator family transporter [Gaiellaceae bacterium]
MSPQRRTALVSVVAACVLIGLKLVTGLATDSLGLVSEAAHSGTDLVAALLTLFAVGVAVRPADRGHPYGHGKAEHLAALGEAGLLVLASLYISYRALTVLVGSAEPGVDPAWYALVVVGLVIVIDASRTTVSLRASRRYGSAALAAQALHFGSDLAGSTAVLGGLLLARAGWREGDSAAALFVALLVLLAAGRLMRTNIDVLMDRVPADAERAARAAIARVEPRVELRRLRMRQAAGRHFADVVIGVSPDDAVGQGHAAADAVEAAVQSALPESDIVVHVEPSESEAAVRERVHAAALTVPRVREVHNLRLVAVDGGLQVALHLKLPGELTLEDAHVVASRVEQAIGRAVPEVVSVQTHLEPLREPGPGSAPAEADVEADAEAVLRIVRDATGAPPRELRFLQTEDGLVVLLTLALDPASALAQAHARASEVEEEIRRALPGIADVIVHTEP